MSQPPPVKTSKNLPKEEDAAKVTAEGEAVEMVGGGVDGRDGKAGCASIHHGTCSGQDASEAAEGGAENIPVNGSRDEGFQLQGQTGEAGTSSPEAQELERRFDGCGRS